MLSKNPLELASPDKRFDKEKLAEALRLSIIAELDAINLYLQLAEKIEDEKFRKVFLDIAREEKTHVGEFLSLLKILDPEQVGELKAGSEEVKELTGFKIPNDPITISKKSEKVNEEETQGGEITKNALENSKKYIADLRTFRKHLPVSILGTGTENVLVYDLREKRMKPILLHEISVRIEVPQRLVEYAEKTRDYNVLSIIYDKAAEFASLENRVILNGCDEFKGLLNDDRVLNASISSWDEPGTAVTEISNALKLFMENNIVPPYKLFISPSRYAKLVRVYEKAGIMELERLKKLVNDVVVTSVLQDNLALLISANKNYLDIVYSVDTRYDYIGLENGNHVYRLWETLALRIRNPKAIIVLKEESEK